MIYGIKQQWQLCAGIRRPHGSEEREEVKTLCSFQGLDDKGNLKQRKPKDVH